LGSDELDPADPIQMMVQDRKLLTDWVLPRINYRCCRQLQRSSRVAEGTAR
jgi:hypothetical protein